MKKAEQSPKKEVSTGMKVLRGCGALLVILVVCVVIFSYLGFLGQQGSSTNNGQENTTTLISDPFDTPSKMNEPVVVQDVQWNVVEAKDLGSKLKNKYGAYMQECVANSGKFIQIKVKIKNNSKQMVTITNLDLYDSNKNEYKTSSDVYSCVNDDIFVLENINPGIEKTFNAVYEVPSTSSGFRLKVGDLNLFSDNYKYISIGF